MATAANFAAESSTGTNVNVCTTDDFTKSVDALVYYIDPDNEDAAMDLLILENKIAVYLSDVSSAMIRLTATD